MKTFKQWALISGSSHGLGLEIALLLAKNGYQIILTGRDRKRLESGLNAIKSISSQNHIAISLDLTQEGAPNELYVQIKNENISPVLIVNNLGGSVNGDKKNIPIKTLRKSMRLNLEIGIEINNLFYEDLKKNNGTVIHIGSTASLHYDAPPGYVISKAALNAYVKNASKNFAKDNICLFAILPGILDHDGSYINNLKKSDIERYEQFLSNANYERFITSSEIAKLIVKLLETQTPMLNGSLIQVDGGGV